MDTHQPRQLPAPRVCVYLNYIAHTHTHTHTQTYQSLDRSSIVRDPGDEFREEPPSISHRLSRPHVRHRAHLQRRENVVNIIGIRSRF
jgi:hypothetical protein